jgi:uncharacterized membrane protein YccF (DUF307 family)
MSVIGNLLWVVLGGLITSVLWVVAGILMSITVIGIPLGMQCFKIAGFVLWPFGRRIELGDFGVGGLLLNILWIVLLGWELAIAHLFFAALLAITVVGIPFALQHVKLAKLAFLPFGARVVSRH